MTNPERDPAEIVAGPGSAAGGVEVLVPREVPLGGTRPMLVRDVPIRTLPVGAWCFAEHYGPHDVTDDRRHGRRPAPAHRPADRELAVRRRDRAPRQRGHHAWSGRRAQPDDRRARHRPLRVSTPRHHPARRPALGGAARRRPYVGAGIRPPVPGARVAGRRPACSWAPCSGTRPPDDVHAVSGAEIGPDAGARVDLAVDTNFEHGMLVHDGVGQGGGEGAEPAELPTSPRADLPDAGRPRRRPGAAAWRAAVRRVDPHVVELRRPHPRGDRRLPRRLEAAVTDAGIVDGRFGVVSDMPPIPAPSLPNARLRSR